MTKLKKTQIVTKLKNSNCDKTQNLNFDNSKTQMDTKVKKKQILTKVKNSNCDNIQKLKL